MMRRMHTTYTDDTRDMPETSESHTAAGKRDRDKAREIICSIQCSRDDGI